MKAAFPRASRVQDHWRVNSYGYPGFFSGSEKSQEAWTTFLSFFRYTNYGNLKSYWGSPAAPRNLSSAAVESWKATFEEFGILYVESGSNRISITPAGMQLREAAERGDRNEFAWIGLNLLLRYPLRGPRQAKSRAHEGSDLLLYRFWYAALLDLGGYVWRTELECILCRVFLTEEASDAVQDVQTLRLHPELISRIDLPVPVRKGAFYNSINQVVVHAGLNHMLLGVEDASSPYSSSETHKRHFIRHEWTGMIRMALASSVQSPQALSNGLASNCLPLAPRFSDEMEYFDYIGTRVTSMAEIVSSIGSSALSNSRGLSIYSSGESYQVRDEFIEFEVKSLHRESEERDAVEQLNQDGALNPTERLQIGKARIGQGEYRIAVLRVESCCRVTHVANPDYLRASHIWPWRYATNEERLDPNNGLMLTPHVDFLFDRGLISFADNGDVLISSKADRSVLDALGVTDGLNVGSFNESQRKYLKRHRDGFEQREQIFQS